MEQLPAEKIEKVQVNSPSSSEGDSIAPRILEKLKVGGSSNESEQDSDLGLGLTSIRENESEFDGSDLIAIPIDGKEMSLEALIRAKKYSKITDEQRKEFIDAVEVNGEKIINAAKRFNINYSSAKSILNVYKSEGRAIKKLTRNRGSKPIDGEDPDSQVGTEVKTSQSFSPNYIEQQKTPPVTFDASTQTQTQEEPQGDNYLLALRDRLIASKTDKRENPYSDSLSHDFSRHTGSLGDYSHQQMTTPSSESPFSMQLDGFQSFPSENKGNQQSQYIQQSTSYVSTGNNSQQQYSNSPNTQSYQQQQQGQQMSLGSENRGTYSHNPQSSNQQQQGYTLQQDHKSQAQQYLLAQNNLDQQRLQSAGGYQNQLSSLGFSQPNPNQEFSGMSYTGTGQSQFFSDSASEPRNMMQSNQVQYLQPIMYLMPSNFSNMNSQNGFLPAGLQGLQGLGNFVPLPNSGPMSNPYMFYGGNNQGQGQSQGQGQNQSQNQGQGQNQGQNQSQHQYQNQNQGQSQGQNHYSNQGQYYGPK